MTRRCPTCSCVVQDDMALLCPREWCVARTEAKREAEYEKKKQWAAEREQEAKEIEIFKPDMYDTWSGSP